VRPRKDHRGVDLISDALPFGRIWYGEPDAVTYAISVQSFGAAKAAAPDRVISVCFCSSGDAKLGIVAPMFSSSTANLSRIRPKNYVFKDAKFGPNSR